MDEKIDVLEKLKSMVLGRKFLVLAVSVVLLILGHIESSQFIYIAVAYMTANLGEHILNQRSQGNIHLTQKTVINQELEDV